MTNMTREECVTKIEFIFECYPELSDFTKSYFNNRIDPYLYEDYISEIRCLREIVDGCRNILSVMRTDIFDYNILSRAKYYIEQRIKTIEQ